ncbi:hypothetical protein HK405_010281 [Cladochytrium tenue]|nr:hypothetical protein HK405_010281 [Cladochytrium tenue]
MRPTRSASGAAATLTFAATFIAAVAAVAQLPVAAAHPGAEPGPCPFLQTQPVVHHGRGLGRRSTNDGDAPFADYGSVKEDIKTAFTDSKDFWPADFGNYAPFMIRLAWHCSGSYRISDGRGGCDGARIRFDPELSWADNTNLDKARHVLEPIKIKYGDTLSWGDLIVLTGTTAIESMGGPILGFCGGRVDDTDGGASIKLGNSTEQEAIAPCPVNGNCSYPLGQEQIGLIYVNPEGHMASGDPLSSVPDIRSSFGRMGMTDRQTVALIGGGHSVGKTHGACPTGPGPNPDEDPANPWPGTCGSGALMGKGNNTFTSGFEGPWTTQPTVWSNHYFINLLSYNWTSFKGPGGHTQFRPSAFQGGPEPPAGIRMLVADIALLNDPSYLSLVKEYAANATSLEYDFAHAWYQLTSRDMGPAYRCKGNNVPPPQPFQLPLPDGPSVQPSDFDSAAESIKGIINNCDALGGSSDKLPSGEEFNGALFVTLAWQCMSTYRETDYSGGCNGARIAISPEKDWALNKGLDKPIAALQSLRSSLPSSGFVPSLADTIVLAASVSLQAVGVHDLPDFKGGRVDLQGPLDLDVYGKFTPRDYINDPVVKNRDDFEVMGLSMSEGVALKGRPRSPAYMRGLGYSGSYTDDLTNFSNLYFKLIVEETWTASPNGTLDEYVAEGKPGVFMTAGDLALYWDPETRPWVEHFASDNDGFLAEFAAAWTSFLTRDLAA